MKLTAEQRFWAKVDRTPAGCWLWTAYRDEEGYGRFRVLPGNGPGVKRNAHRYAYELLVGPIPEGLQLDHLCRNRACVNPAHLEPVTARVNMLRSEAFTAAHARKTHCLNGHPLSGENLFTARNGERVCRTCRRDRQQKHLAKMDPEVRKERGRLAQARCRERKLNGAR